MLAHNISLINVQAGVALHLIDEQPEQARPALANIKDGEPRRAAGAADRARRAAPRRRGAPARPRPAWPTSTGWSRACGPAGSTCALERQPDAGPLPQPVELAAYRIVQEALTNVTRHAGARTVTVRLDVRRRRDDRGDRRRASAAPRGPGNGIVGMRERAAALGGTLDAGPRPAGGFRVRAPTCRCGRRDLGRASPTTRPWCGPGSAPCSTRRTTSTVVGEAADGDEAVRLALEHRPDVVLMDIRMPGVDGLAATRRSPTTSAGRREGRDPDDVRPRRVRVRGDPAGRQRVPGQGHRAGELLRAVRAVVAGDALLSPRVTRRLIEEFADPGRRTRPASRTWPA